MSQNKYLTGKIVHYVLVETKLYLKIFAKKTYYDRFYICRVLPDMKLRRKFSVNLEFNFKKIRKKY